MGLQCIMNRGESRQLAVWTSRQKKTVIIATVLINILFKKRQFLEKGNKFRGRSSFRNFGMRNFFWGCAALISLSTTDDFNSAVARGARSCVGRFKLFTHRSSLMGCRERKRPVSVGTLDDETVDFLSTAEASISRFDKNRSFEK